MAHAKTYQLEDFGNCNWMDDEDSACKVCGKRGGQEWRIFYYPTYMNGDAEFLGSWCGKHKREAGEALAEFKANHK